MKKIGVILLIMVLCMSGCSLVDKYLENSDETINQPTTQVQSSSNEIITKTPTETTFQIQPTDIPQGDFAEDVVITLDPGHGGKFGGAFFDNRREQDLNLTVATYAKQYLEENYNNVTVVMTRTTDDKLADKLSKDLEQRAVIAKEAKSDALVSIHFNTTQEHNQHGAMIIISRMDHVTDVCKGLAESIMEQFSNLGLQSQGIITRKSNTSVDENGSPLDYYAINRQCANRDIPGIIVEHCFMDNITDIPFIDSEEDLKALGKADAIGIANYFGLSKKSN